ncbi:MAG TPA: outer membrane protein assembly factor BamA [Urbifossiella sp.]
MTVCRFRTALIAAILAVAAFGVYHRAGAAESTEGRIVARIGPVGNRVHTSEQIVALLHTKPGKPYIDAVAQDDVRRLESTKWFTPGTVKLFTQIEPDGKISIIIHVSELISTVQDIEFLGAQHISPKELGNITFVRKGEPMNPLANEQARKAILQKYQDDGRYFATVELLEGGKAGDTRVIFQIVEGPVVKVRAVEFRGNSFAQSGRLKTQLVTKKAFIGFFGGKFNQMSLDADMKQILEYYHRLGYLSAHITPEVVRTEELSRVIIVYHIDEGTQYKVSEIEILNSRSYPVERLQPLTQLKPGQRYDEGIVKSDLKTLENYHGYRGLLVHTDKNLTQDQNDPSLVKVQYLVQGDPGQKSRVGRVLIDGNTITQQRVILNQLGLRPGQILQYPMLEDARMRLNRLGIFDQNNPPTVEVLPNEMDNEFKDVVVRLNETRTGQFMVGGGVNSNAGLNGSIVLNERNFDISRFPSSWDDFRQGRAWRGAGQEFSINAQPGTQYSRYSASFREPYLFDTPFGMTDSLYFQNRSYVEYFENRIGGRFGINRMLSPAWSTSLTTRVEEVEVKDFPDYAPPAITDNAGWHFLVGLRAGLHRDTRDSYLFPSRGNVFDIGFEQVTGDYTYPVATTSMTQFFNTWHREDGSGKHVLALRSQLGIAGANTPVYDRFYAGGFGTIRGFTFRGVGPETYDLHTGGRFSFLNTIEYQMPILQNDKLFFVTFLDHGTVENSVEIKNYRASVGFGFRIAVPALGPQPIALDFAFPLAKMDGDNTQMFSFYVGMFGGN